VGFFCCLCCVLFCESFLFFLFFFCFLVGVVFFFFFFFWFFCFLFFFFFLFLFVFFFFFFRFCLVLFFFFFFRTPPFKTFLYLPLFPLFLRSFLMCPPRTVRRSLSTGFCRVKGFRRVTPFFQTGSEVPVAYSPNGNFWKSCFSIPLPQPPSLI